MTDLPPVRLVQFNPLVGDIDGNRARIEARLEGQGRPSIWVFPELALCGYPPEDLLLRDDFIGRVDQALEELARCSAEHWLIVGAPVRENGALFNAACVLHQGQRAGFARKRLLPHYDVFDEQRHFVPGSEPFIVEAGRRLQLQLYALAAREQLGAERLVARYAYLDPRAEEWALDSADAADEALIDEAKRHAEVVRERVEAGDFRVNPQVTPCPGYCAFRHACRVNQFTRSKWT